MVALVVLRNKAIKPLLAAAQRRRKSRGAQNPDPSISTTKLFARQYKASLTSWAWPPKHRQLLFQTCAKRLKGVAGVASTRTSGTDRKLGGINGKEIYVAVL
jgi:hypothetical protein